ncbi:hypothetical protein VE03_06859 [Pseudogymnoascus sp. 23342-1-I1]|nr:hypothetical protein VE03_06859 [Pseudogymnoascus sp. 23342-1-I1]
MSLEQKRRDYLFAPATFELYHLNNYYKSSSKPLHDYCHFQSSTTVAESYHERVCHHAPAAKNPSHQRPHQTPPVHLRACLPPPWARLPEYEALANSGKVWEDHFKPRDLGPWLEAQKKLESTLESVEKFRAFFEQRPELRSAVTHSLITEWAHQSTSIEANPLLLGDAFLIAEGLESQLFSRYEGFGTISTQALSELNFPPARDLAPQDPSQVAELRNHIIVSRHVSDYALANPGTADFEQAAMYSWGPRVPLGEFRALPILVRSNPLRIFPYHQEVPACMKRFFEWRNETHAMGKLHPLVFATKLCVYFASVHPFADGNGRTSRVMMADYLIRQGFLPIVFQDLERLDYLGMISEAQDGEPEGLCSYVAQTTLDMMFTISLR